MLKQNLRFEDLVNLDDWQKAQDSFAEALELTLRTVSLDGRLLSRASRTTRLCNDILSRVKGIDSYCRCLHNEGNDHPPITIESEASVTCPFGLTLFYIPITAVGKRIVAYMVVGPVILKARKSANEYALECQKFGLNPDIVMDALIEINVISYNKARSMVDLLMSSFSYMTQTGYHKKRLGEIAPEVIELDPLFSRYYEEKILRSLLHASTMALDADSGSVMTLDRDTNALHIKVAEKLSDDIVNNTNLKVGEGIAGFAAATSQPIILPQDGNKNGLADKMKRKSIKASMIIPFNKWNSDEVYGVLNLNNLKKNADFTEKDIEVVKELVNMASIALVPLQQSLQE